MKKKKLLDDLNDRQQQSQRDKHPQPKPVGPTLQQVLDDYARMTGMAGFTTQFYSKNSMLQALGASPYQQENYASLPRRRSSEPVVGWRAWRLTQDEEGEPCLMSAFKDTLWRGPVLTAHRAPSLANEVGIHAFRRTWLGGCEYPEAAVEGEVLLYGRVIVHERGIRAERGAFRRLLIRPGGWERNNPPWFGFPGDPMPPNQLLYVPYGRSRPEDNQALLRSLEQRYDCEISFWSPPSVEEIEASRGGEPLAPPAWSSSLIQKPTKEELQWISDAHSK